jgi:hypothetical protein
MVMKKESNERLAGCLSHGGGCAATCSVHQHDGQRLDEVVVTCRCSLHSSTHQLNQVRGFAARAATHYADTGGATSVGVLSAARGSSSGF